MSFTVKHNGGYEKYQSQRLTGSNGPFADEQARIGAQML